MSSPQSGLTIAFKVRFVPGRRGRQTMVIGTTSSELHESLVAPAVGRVPRLSRLMALAIRFEELVARGEVKDYATLSRLGHVTRARVTQIMNLLNLAPDIQEAILFLPLVEAGRDPIKEWQIRSIAAQPDWSTQRRMWRKIAC